MYPQFRGWLCADSGLGGPHQEAGEAPAERPFAVVYEDGGNVSTAEPTLPGMDYLMERYEEELKHPIRHIVNGQLARTLLIQACPFG